jgi:hypothetical protein
MVSQSLRFYSTSTAHCPRHLGEIDQRLRIWLKCAVVLNDRGGRGWARCVAGEFRIHCLR